MRWLPHVLALVLVGFGAWMLLHRQPKPPPAERFDVRLEAEQRQAAARHTPVERAPGQPTPPIARALTAEEKAQRIAQIKRDYDEVRAKIAAEYSAAGKDFPGGLNAFLRQLALLEREKRLDFAAVLDAAELETLEYRETTAGQLVARLLDGTPTSDELKRAVFRKQLAYEDRFALTFDISPKGLLERETARQGLQAEIRALLGDALFTSWLQGEGGDIAGVARVVRDHGLPPERVLELWQAKAEFVRRRLELNARGLEPAQVKGLQRELAREMNARVDHLLGTTVPQSARREALGWLPEK